MRKFFLAAILALSAVATAASAQDAFTPNLGLTKPPAGGSDGAWAPKLNGNADALDAEWAVTARGDADYTVLSTDRYIRLTSPLTAQRTFTLPPANSRLSSQPLVIMDPVGAISNADPLVIAGAGTDTANGTASVALRDPYSVAELRSDGASKWTVSVPRATAEGTWTPVLGLATAGTSSFSASNSGYWKRDGNRITVTFAISFTPTLGTGSGNLEISGLPFLAGSASYGQATGSINQLAASFTGLSSRPNVVPMLLTTGKIGFAVWGVGAGTGTLGAANLTDGAAHAVRGSLTYFIDP